MKGACHEEVSSLRRRPRIFGRRAGFLNPGQTHIKPLILVSESLLINSKLMKHGRMQIPHMNNILNGVVTEFVSCSV